MKKYFPEPLDTSDVILSDDVKILVERLAENVHDSWAKKRLDEGWVRGEERNDELRTHPSLIPYEELSEIEKEYDRTTAKETIKFLLKMGYRLEKE